MKTKIYLRTSLHFEWTEPKKGILSLFVQKPKFKKKTKTYIVHLRVTEDISPEFLNAHVNDKFVQPIHDPFHKCRSIESIEYSNGEVEIDTWGEHATQLIEKESEIPNWIENFKKNDNYNVVSFNEYFGGL